MNIKPGTWMRNRETGEVVRVEENGYFIKYKNDEVDGEVQLEHLAKHFDVLDRKPADADQYLMA